MIRQLRLALRAGIVTEPVAPDAELERLGRQVEGEIQRVFGRSLHIRQVDAGSCNGCELEISGLTGPVTRNMAEALRRTWEATPEPKIVVAAGDCARDGGIFAGSYAVVGGVGAVVPVDAVIAGCPPTPKALLAGLLAAIGRRGGAVTH